MSIQSSSPKKSLPYLIDKYGKEDITVLLNHLESLLKNRKDDLSFEEALKVK